MSAGSKRGTTTTSKTTSKTPKTPAATSTTVAILGGGRFGRAVAQVLARSGADVRLWARRELLRAQVKSEVPGLEITDSLEEAAQGASIVIFAVPAPAMPEIAARFGPVATGDQIALHPCRGVADLDVFLLPHQAIRRETCIKKIGVLGGPLYVEDMDKGRPLVAVLGSRYDEVIESVRKLVSPSAVKLHATRDLVGVEVAGAISNVTVIAAGMADALGLGETVRGVLLTHGLSEATRLGLVLGAELTTFAGLAGVGELIPREVTSVRRNEKLGRLIAQGKPLDEALAEANGAVEGIVTAREAVRLASRHHLELPLVTAVDDVLSGRREARAALDDVLTHDIELGAELAR